MSILPYTQKNAKADASISSIGNINNRKKLPGTSQSEPAVQTQNESALPASEIKPDASISLTFDKQAGKCRLASRRHFGQLYVQKPFYPEGPDVCHVVLVHPPGGVVGGDRLEIASHVGADASVQITTPGAAKWYKSNGRISFQNVAIDVKTGATMEWLPQETIFFDDAQVELAQSINLEKDSIYIGCEIFCLGRTAFGESFNSGRIRQKVTIQRENQLIWYEQLNLHGGSKAMRSPLIMADKTVCATLLAASNSLHAGDLINALRSQAADIDNGDGMLGVSQVKSVIVARYLGNSSEVARAVMLKLWDVLRPALLGRAAQVPRMWNT
ncbi:urease accessory protein [Nitrosomonas sp. Nm51]|uniref:urease accessory protein UreD n=1 Tax=Nitrosomonas sp. Nm51 TaxID=133720 RepID=UPI0008C22AE6|nr:urease accessory protein UreD [Nitrosomonas sp. Nm51]SER06115.1 urease accessory protein [Nitrosomonas sp. Nm51]